MNGSCTETLQVRIAIDGKFVALKILKKNNRVHGTCSEIKGTYAETGKAFASFCGKFQNLKISIFDNVVLERDGKRSRRNRIKRKHSRRKKQKHFMIIHTAETSPRHVRALFTSFFLICTMIRHLNLTVFERSDAFC